MIDATRAVRPGEELDAAPLRAWLADHLPEAAGSAELEIEQFPGGHSNLTYLLRLGDRELVLRRPPFGSKVKTAHDMGREYRVLSRLHAVYPKAPRALACCDDPAVIGAPFYVMERVRGVILRHQKLPPGMELAPEDMRRISEAAVDGLAELHAVDYEAAGLGDLGRPAGYVERQVTGWTERWKGSRTDDVPDVDNAFAWLAGNLPPESGAALIHNDYKYDNLVLAPDLSRIVAVLDWEMTTVGDPLMDLGTSLGYWMDPDDAPGLRALPAGPTTLLGNLTRTEVAQRYAERSGRDVSDILFYYVYGLLKIAVIAQQIYYRYKQGLTKDERFAGMIGAVRLLGRRAAEAIGKGDLAA
ncbi:MAG TPA: phosphotransferase family protein [Thermoanaerobaculia bacterium]